MTRPAPKYWIPHRGSALSDREWQVAHLIKVGKSNKVIAYELSVTTDTIKVHIHHLLQRTGATSRTHLVWLLFLSKCTCQQCGRVEMDEAA